MRRVFVDSSAWLAYVNRRDADHVRVREAIAEFDGRLVSSSYVFDETITLCATRLGHDIAVKIGELLRDSGAVDLIRVTGADEEKAWELFRSRADKSYSFTDCTSFALMRRLEMHDVVALDEDFRREGFSVVP